MNFFGNYSFGFVFVAIAVVHFIRRRPDTFWLWIILMGGGLGSLIYIFVEVLPDLGLLRQSFQVFSHRKRISQLETMVLDNPSAGIMKSWPTSIWSRRNLRRPNSATISRFLLVRTHLIRFTGAPSVKLS